MKKITKLMLTLALLLVGVTGAKAEEAWVQVKSVNYSAYTGFPFYVMGFVPEWNNGIMTDLGGNYTYKKVSEASQEEAEVGVKVMTNDGTEYYRLRSTGTWHQYFIANGIPTNPDKTYIVKAMIKASKACKINVEMRWSWSEDPVNVEKSIPISDDFEEVTWVYSGIGGNSCDLIAQINSDAQIEWKSVEVGYNVDWENRAEPAEPATPKYGKLIKKIDYSTTTDYPYHWMGDMIEEHPDKPNFCNGSATVQIIDGALQIANTKAQSNFWDLQPFIIDQVTMQEGCYYVVRIKMNTIGAGSARVVLGKWGEDYYKDFNFADDYAYYDIELGKATFSANDNAHALLQCGSFVGKIAIDKVEVFEVLPKQELSDKIALAKKYSSLVYTAASFAELGSKIEAAETVLAASDATLESIENAVNALTTAINGLQLKVGFSTLSKDMYKHHESLENPGEGTTTDCEYVVGTSTGQPYGDSQVHYLNWADLSAYKKLVILVAEGTPRIMMNRQEPIAVGSEGYDSHGGAYVQLTDAPVNGVVEVDLTQYSDARLNAIKGANYGNVTVLGMYLYRDMSYGIIGDLTGGFDVDDVNMTATETEGEYTLTVTDFVVNEVKAYEYKLRANDVYGIYDLPAGNENKSWTPTEGIGIYSLTFTANVLSHTLTCVGTKTADFVYAVVGCTYDGSTDVQSDLFAGTKAWDTNTTDVMTKQNDGTYVWKKNEVELPAKWIDLKVVARNGENVIKWYGNATNGGNVGLNITDAGIYNVTVTFNGSSVTATAEKQPTATVYFVNDNNWPAENIKIWVWDANNNNYNYTGGTWPGQTMTATGEKIDGKDVYTWSTYALNPTPTTLIISNNGSDTERTGDQPFVNGATYRADGSSTVTKTISAAGYATYCSEAALDFSESGLTAYVANYDGSRVNFTEVTSVPAKTGVLLKGAAGEYTIKTTNGGALGAVQNILIGVLEETLVDHSGIYVLMNGDEGVGFYKTTSDHFTVGAHTAYIDAIAGARSFISLDGETTAIEGIAAEKINNGEVYNLNGQRVAQPTKGLYIVNGRKVVVK